MSNTRYRINFNLSPLVEGGGFTLNKESEQGFEPSGTLGFESAVENFLEYYNFLPLFNASFSLVTSLGAVVNVEPAPLKVKTDTNPKGKIIELQIKEGNGYKFFVADSDIYKPKDIIDQLMWGLREIGNNPKEYTLSVKGSCCLSEALGYMIINSDFFNDPISRWQNGEYDVPHAQVLEEEVAVEIKDTFTKGPYGACVIDGVFTLDPNEPVKGLNTILSKLTDNPVIPIGLVNINQNTQWSKNMLKAWQNPEGISLNNTSNDIGWVVKVADTNSNDCQDYFIKTSVKHEASREIKSYLMDNFNNLNWDSINVQFLEIENMDYLYKKLVNEIMNTIQTQIEYTEMEIMAPSPEVTTPKGISTDFTKRD